MLAHNRRYVTRVMRAIRQGVDRVNPHLVLGYMSTDTSYTGREWEEWPQALAGPDRLAVKWRPGGGFYTDDSQPCCSAKPTRSAVNSAASRRR